MIDKVTLSGFQAHKESKFEFLPGLNIIIGPSNTGKTAVLRAIRWVAQNEPLGDAFLNKDMKTCAVTIEAGNTIVARLKGSSGNSYIIDGETYQGFGTKVPDEVYAAIGMRKATFGDGDAWLNYASQLDAPFLLSETSGQAARILGKLAGTEDLDAASKLSNSDLIKSRQDAQSYKNQKQLYKEELQQYEGLDELKVLSDKALALDSDISDRKSRLEALIKLHKSLTDNTDILRELSEAVYLIRLVDIEPVTDRLMRLRGLIDVADVAADIGLQLSRVVKRLSKVEARLSCELLSAAEKRYEKCRELSRVLCAAEENQKALSIVEKRAVALSDLNDVSGLEGRASRVEILRSIKTGLKNNTEITARHVSLCDVCMSVGDTQNIECRIQRMKSLFGICEQIIDKDRQIDRAEETYKTVQGDIVSAAENYSKHLQEIGKCPVCGSELSIENIKKHIKELIA